MIYFDKLNPSYIPQVEEIDLSQPEDVVLEKVRSACTSTGFTILRNHGICQELLDAALANCEAFFSLPEEKKESLKSDIAFTVGHYKCLQFYTF